MPFIVIEFSFFLVLWESIPFTLPAPFVIFYTSVMFIVFICSLNWTAVWIFLMSPHVEVFPCLWSFFPPVSTPHLFGSPIDSLHEPGQITRRQIVMPLLMLNSILLHKRNLIDVSETTCGINSETRSGPELLYHLPHWHDEDYTVPSFVKHAEIHESKTLSEYWEPVWLFIGIFVGCGDHAVMKELVKWEGKIFPRSWRFLKITRGSDKRKGLPGNNFWEWYFACRCLYVVK